ncbi:MAG TPA: T9SS type A sorting domain-containing protein [Bacteroidales bacterium]|nr:T9SS type A sorting domain-containing protein [Bacteroidales bacterium]
MNTITKIFKTAMVLLALCFVMPVSGQRIEFNYPDAWGNSGYNLVRQDHSGVRVIHSIPQLAIFDYEVDEVRWQMIDMEGISLPNDEGSPNLPGNGRYIAIPQGATATLNINAVRTQVVQNVDLLPAPNIPLTNDDSPLRFEKNMEIYGQDAFFPAEPFRLSEPTSIRGVDVVMLGITPFQYNPVTKELIIYHDIDVEVEFTGGNGRFGDDRLRSRWWDPILEDAILNLNMLPKIDYGARYKALMDSRSEGYEYIVVVPDHPDFLAWGDSIRVFRNRQGIPTQLVTTTEMGGNNFAQMKNYITNAYNTWELPPAAILFLADYGTSGNTITSGTQSNYITDNLFVDMNGNHMPDITAARITARHAADLEIMVSKFLNYERNPPTNPVFYNKPITAMGWQTDRWFQICAESIAGFWENELDKETVRQNNIYSGTPGTTWSTNSNTSLVTNVFGPNGLGYIPATPEYLHGHGWNANATSINQHINAGTFMILHRDHGLETGWGEPHYRNEHLSGLTNEDLTYVFSINCLTGKFNWTGGESFAEAFHRHQYGALGIMAATEVSYSFVNDTYAWGAFNNMWPQFLPMYGTTPEHRGVLPAFANSAGKYFLEQSNWPSNPNNKHITYYLFHHHGDAFSTVYTEMPQQLTVDHMSVLLSGLDVFEVTANAGSLIALSINGELIGVAEGTGMPVAIPIEPQLPGNELLVTITLQNYYRYEALLEIIPPDGPYVIYSQSVVNDPTGNNNGLIDYGETINLDVALKNVGLDPALNVLATLSTASEYVNITDNTHEFGDFLPDEVIMLQNAFTFEVSDEVPDNYVIYFEIAMTSDTNTWVSTFNLTAYAPEFSIGHLAISDPLGNNNGQADPGETVNLIIPTTNSGNSQAFDIAGVLTSSNPYLTIDVGEITFTSLEAGESANAVFTVTIDEDAPIGTPILLNYHVETGIYAAEKDFVIQVGLILEDFESGDFSMFPWTSAGNLPWTITDVDPYQGVYCAKSGSITHNQSTQLILDYDVGANDSISFYRKVSSENNYDFLKFYINDQMVGQWSGSFPWERVVFPVTPGFKTFKWEYMKDGSVSSGEDCAWIDYIILPVLAACPAPVNLHATSVTSAEATLNWLPGGAQVLFDVLWGESGFDPTSAGTLIENLGGNTYLLTGLSAVTVYDFYVRAHCDDELASYWSGPASFTTLCDIFELPYFEPFGTPAITCWSFPEGQGNWNFGSSYTPPSSTSGAPNAFFNWSPSVTNYSFSLVSPLIDGTSMTEVKLDFILYINNFSSSTVENMAVEFKALDDTEWTMLELFTTAGLGSGNAEHVRTDQVLEGMGGHQFQVRFRAHGPNSYNINGWGLDDIHLHGEFMPALPGDANCDGEVNVLDAITTVNYIMGNNPEPFCWDNADVTEDGIINVLDIIATVNIIMGGSKTSPFEVQSSAAHIFMNPDGITLESDGTLAGLQFEIFGLDRTEINFLLNGYEFVSTEKDGKLLGLIFSFNNTPIPGGAINLFSFGRNEDLPQWGDVVAGNLNAEAVPVIKHFSGSDGVLAASTGLEVYPNPTAGHVHVQLSLPVASGVRIKITDITGREIKSLAESKLSAGIHSFEITKDQFLNSGIYFVHASIIPEQDHKKIITKRQKLIVVQ